jgi:hypothetical protein
MSEGAGFMSARRDLNDPAFRAAYVLVQTMKPGASRRRRSRAEEDPWDNRPLTNFEVAEAVVMAKDGLTLRFCQGWAKEPPGDIEADSRTAEFFKAGAGVMVAILESGYDEPSQTWWPVVKGWSKDETLVKFAHLADFGDMLWQIQHPPVMKMIQDYAANRPPLLIPGSLWLYMDLILGYGWRKRWAALSQKMIAAAQERRSNAAGQGEEG